MNWWQTILIILATAGITWIGHSIIARREARIQRFIRRDELMKDLYIEYCNFFYKGITTGKIAKMKEAEIKEKMGDMTVRMLLFASDDTLKLFSNFQQSFYQADENAELTPAETIEKFTKLGEIVVQMRKDYSRTWTTIKPQEVFKPLLTDYETWFPTVEKKKRES